jgi:hypothetical protein
MPASISASIYIGHVNFFRNRLLVLDSNAIGELIEGMETQTRNIRLDVLKLCWYMRGGVTYDEAMQMSQSERDIIDEIIKDNLETTKKSGLPFF